VMHMYDVSGEQAPSRWVWCRYLHKEGLKLLGMGLPSTSPKSPSEK